MKFSMLLRSLIVPFLMFTLLGIDCPPEEDEPQVCKEFSTTKTDVKRLNDSSSTEMEVVTGTARAECSAKFIIKFGWDFPEKFTSEGADSPMEESLAGLKLTFGDKSFNNVFTGWNIAGPVRGTNPDNEQGYVWFVELPVESVADEGNTRFFVKIEHDVIDVEFNVFVDVIIEYSST